jgi:putative salt-induced outer membrane protein
MTRPSLRAAAPLRAFAALLVLAPALRAQDPDPVVTKITADLGYVAVSGNTQVSTFNIGEKVTQARGRLSLEQSVALVYSKQADSVTTNYLRANLRGDFKIDKLLAVFTGVTFDRNRFAGIERRFEEQLGITARILGTTSDTVRIEGGGTFTQQIGTDGIQENFPSARGAISWRHAFTAAAYFQQNVEYIPNMKETVDWRVNTESGIVAPLSSRISLKVSHVIRYDNLPQPGFMDTDRLFTSGLQITF